MQQRVHHTGELNKEPIAHRLKQTTFVLCYLRLDFIGAKGTNAGERASLVFVHHLGVTDDIGCDNSGWSNGISLIQEGPPSVDYPPETRSRVCPRRSTSATSKLLNGQIWLFRQQFVDFRLAASKITLACMTGVRKILTGMYHRGVFVLPKGKQCVVVALQ